MAVAWGIEQSRQAPVILQCPVSPTSGLQSWQWPKWLLSNLPPLMPSPSLLASTLQVERLWYASVFAFHVPCSLVSCFQLILSVWDTCISVNKNTSMCMYHLISFDSCQSLRKTSFLLFSSICRKKIMPHFCCCITFYGSVKPLCM